RHLFTPAASPPAHLPPFPTRRSSDLSSASMTTSCGRDRSTRCSTSPGSGTGTMVSPLPFTQCARKSGTVRPAGEKKSIVGRVPRSEEHTSELQSLRHLVCRLLLEKKK